MGWDMIKLSFFNGNGGLSEAEIAVATPDESEAKDLAVHVKRCALRFRLLAEGQNHVASDMNQIKLILICVGGYLVLVSAPAQTVISKLLGVLS